MYWKLDFISIECKFGFCFGNEKRKLNGHLKFLEIGVIGDNCQYAESAYVPFAYETSKPTIQR